MFIQQWNSLDKYSWLIDRFKYQLPFIDVNSRSFPVCFTSWNSVGMLHTWINTNWFIKIVFYILYSRWNLLLRYENLWFASFDTKICLINIILTLTQISSICIKFFQYIQCIVWFKYYENICRSMFFCKTIVIFKTE